MREKPSASKPKEFSIRLTPTLYRRIKTASENGSRTINAEIVRRLELSFADHDVDAKIEAAMMKVLGGLLEVTVKRKEVS